MLKAFITCFFLLFSLSARANVNALLLLQKAYPDHIQSVTNDYIVWADGSIMPTSDNNSNKTEEEKLTSPSLSDQVNQASYVIGIPLDTEHYQPSGDPGRIRYEPFFRKMYGNSQEEVESKLVTVYWMPHVFGHTYPLLITTVNGVDKKLLLISNELETLVSTHPEYLPFLQEVTTYNWRYIANTNRLSNHSFGMTIDINPSLSDYWQWDLAKAGQPIAEDGPLIYRNSIPWAIVPLFEKHGFIWGGKWAHYDSMHFEYRPELLPIA